ncbi:MAG: hypothetical protein M3Z04_22760 [Chloroflexota bacterium]|nr:hypothetical protein [Chloroflexota bacterium]
MMRIRTGFLLGLGVLLCSCLARPALAAPGETKQTQTTAQYGITLTFGAAAAMLLPDQAAGAQAGEVQVAMPGMPMPAMSETDQGRPVNHHLEIAIVNKTSGAVITDQMPMITLKNDTTGATRSLEPVMAMYDVQVGKQDTHFGGNLYLPDGTYTVTAVVNGETATFSKVIAGAGSPLSAGALPQTGAPLTVWTALLLIVGNLALGAGLLLRHARRAA